MAAATTAPQEPVEREDDDFGASFLFAPKNTAVFDPGTGKKNFFGLGADSIPPSVDWAAPWSGAFDRVMG